MANSMAEMPNPQRKKGIHWIASRVCSSSHNINGCKYKDEARNQLQEGPKTLQLNFGGQDLVLKIDGCHFKLLCGEE